MARLSIFKCFCSLQAIRPDIKNISIGRLAPTGRKALGWVGGCLVLAFLAGCVHYPPPPPAKPEWTSQGSGAVHGEKGPVFQGTSAAENIKQGSLLRATAENRARAQLAGLLEQYINALVQYAGYYDLAPEDRQAVGSVVRQGLDQAVISEHWRDENSEKLYARCILELAALKDILASAALPDDMSARMAAGAEHVFEAFVSGSP